MSAIAGATGKVREHVATIVVAAARTMAAKS